MPINIPDESELNVPYALPVQNLLGELEPTPEFIESYNERLAAGEIRYETAPFDARFPNANQTKNCWQNYADYQRCIKIKGEDYGPCQYFQKIFKEICPSFWVSAETFYI